MKQVVVVLILFFGALLQAVDGELDPSFGMDGKLLVTFGGSSSRAADVLVQPDKKIVLVGRSTTGGTAIDYAVARLNEDSSYDTDFNMNGLVTTDLGGASDLPEAAALQKDGKIVVVGQTNPSGTPLFSVVRYNHNGSLDASFGTLGMVTTNFGGSSQTAQGVVLQEDGKIVAAGSSNAAGNFGVSLARYNTDGSLDTSFGTNGLVTTNIGPGTDQALAVLLQPDGKIVAIGSATISGDIVFALVRYNSDGSIDSTFGSSGIVLTDIGGTSNAAFDGELQPDGKIVVAGFTNRTGSFDFAVARYNLDSSLDTSFGTDGIVVTNVGGGVERADVVLSQSEGKIITVGQSDATGQFDFALVGYNSDGSLDTNFGNNGIILTSFGGTIDQAFGAVLQADGKLVATGRSNVSGSDEFATARYLIPSATISTLARDIRAKYFLLQ